MSFVLIYEHLVMSTLLIMAYNRPEKLKVVPRKQYVQAFRQRFLTPASSVIITSDWRLQSKDYLYILHFIGNLAHGETL